MNPGDVPFLNFTPAFEEPALAFSQAVVAGYVCWEQHQQLPRSNLIFNQIGAKTMLSSTFSNSKVLLETRRLQHGVPTSHETIDCHAALLPVFGESLHSRLGCRFDMSNNTLKVGQCDAVLCVLHDGQFHFRLLVVVLNSLKATICLWDPMQGWVGVDQLGQVAQAAKVLERLLPSHTIVPGLRSQRHAWLSSDVSSQLQPRSDSSECGVWCSRALSHLVLGVDFDLSFHSKEAMRRYRVWMTACLAQGRLHM